MCNAKGKQCVVRQGHEPEELGLGHSFNFGIFQANSKLSGSFAPEKRSVEKGLDEWVPQKLMQTALHKSLTDTEK